MELRTINRFICHLNITIRNKSRHDYNSLASYLQQIYTTMKLKLFTLSIFSFVLSFSNIAQGPITEICLATVDTSSTFNIIAWERTAQTSALPIDSMQIYRRTFGGNDSLIATVEYDSLSEYHDMTANPNLRAYMYRIAGKDVSGTVGPLSLPARTIHFVVVENPQGEFWLKWTPYIGKPIDFYQCWDLVLGSAPDLINSTSNNTDTAWTFGAAIPQTTYEMKVDVSWTSGCTSTKANHNTTRSNQASGLFVGDDVSSVEENSIQEVYFAPNPTSGNSTLVFSSLSWTPINVSIIDMQGRVVYRQAPIKVLGQYTMDLDLSNLSNGLYNVIIDNGTINAYRLMKN